MSNSDITNADLPNFSSLDTSTINAQLDQNTRAQQSTN